jgi:hypothetical protein
VANLPPVSTTPAANFATSFTSVVDTGGKLPQVSMTPAANIPPVSLQQWDKYQAADTLKGQCHEIFDFWFFS